MDRKKFLLLMLKCCRPTDGFTILESLVASVVVSVLLVAITPLVAISVSARVQARRVDLATSAGRGFIDRVTSRAITLSQLRTQPTIRVTSATNSYFFDQVPAPGGGGGIAPAALNNLPGVRVDTNGNGFSTDDPQDLVIQPMYNDSVFPDPSFRPTGTDSDPFEVAARVYRADAFTGGANITGTVVPLQRGESGGACGQSGTTFGARLGNRNCPLVIIRGEVSRDVVLR
ncbi:MAG: prepilin-type N-terminal cleavage/methylation domain-containing protein [Oscillatoriales cyanobacterium SM2_2_1]|nr:prepilin-type N-terminal cleavage/methylation domain-containing protein [Oscillatoriales cyanobacterium SM2_2_1]